MTGAFIRRGRRFERFDAERIRYFRGEPEGCLIVLCDEVIRIPIHLAALQPRLDPDKFCRVHDKFIVALENVEAFDTSSVKICGETIPIGEEYLTTFFSRVWTYPERC